MFPFGYGEAISDDKDKENAEEEEFNFRPPGAMQDENDFLKLCKRSKKCSEACPHDAIFFPGIEGGKNENTPFMDPANKPCRWCRDMPCIDACPSGALKKISFDDILPVGLAVIDTDLCSTYNGILCDICITSCPSWIKAVRMNSERHPEIIEEKCTGCGLCAYYCDAVPDAISIIK